MRENRMSSVGEDAISNPYSIIASSLCELILQINVGGARTVHDPTRADAGKL